VPRSVMEILVAACAKFTSNVTFQQEAVPAVLIARVPSSDLNEISIAHFFIEFFSS
jgi:hypothetical protein